MAKNNLLTRREIAFREKQRKKSTFQPLKAVEKKIQETREIIQFGGWPTIAKVNYSAYSGIMFYVNSIIQPNIKYERAVGNLIVNLFSENHNCFCQEGEYEKSDRSYTKSQLIRFNDSLKTLECLIGLETKERLGNLGRKQIYRPRNIGEMLSSSFYLGSNELDLVALYGPGYIIPKGDEAIDIAREIIYGFSRSLVSKGILIVDSSTVNVIGGFRQVDNYGNITVYQKES